LLLLPLPINQKQSLAINNSQSNKCWQNKKLLLLAVAVGIVLKHTWKDLAQILHTAYPN